MMSHRIGECVFRQRGKVNVRQRPRGPQDDISLRSENETTTRNTRSVYRGERKAFLWPPRLEAVSQYQIAEDEPPGWLTAGRLFAWFKA